MACVQSLRYKFAMTALPHQPMTVEEYLAWSEAGDGRFELVNGVVVEQSAERAAHAEVKFAAAMALAQGIRDKKLDCHVLPDGMAVRVGPRTVYEPDAMIYCGPKLPPGALVVENPLIVIEVLSPSTGRNDASRKLAGYFSLASVRHYLIIDPDEPLVIHHARGDDGIVRTAILREGAVLIDPPGLTLAFADIYPAAV